MTYCIFRTDRIGDVVLTMPLAEAIKRHEPEARVLFCVQEYTADIPRLSPFVDDIVAIPGRDVTSAPEFAKRLREMRIDTTIFAYPRPQVALACALARIPLRVGTAYRGYSLLFNRRLKEHRRDARFHERDYNLHLLERIGIPIEPFPVPTLHIPDSRSQEARGLLAASGIEPDTPFVALHPGSGGSAKDWPADRFGELGYGIVRRFSGMRLLVTGTAAEAPLVRNVMAACGDTAVALAHPVSLGELTAVLSLARLCIANSTGPLHLAAAVGVPVIGLYPFERVCNPRRWGPLGPVTEVLTPPRQDNCENCRNESCPVHDTMDAIGVNDALAKAIAMLKGTENM